MSSAKQLWQKIVFGCSEEEAGVMLEKVGVKFDIVGKEGLHHWEGGGLRNDSGGLISFAVSQVRKVVFDSEEVEVKYKDIEGSKEQEQNRVTRPESKAPESKAPVTLAPESKAPVTLAPVAVAPESKK